MLQVGDWVFTMTTANNDFTEEDDEVVKYIMTTKAENWKAEPDYPRHMSLYRYFKDKGLHKVVFKIEKDRVGYKEKNRLHWIPKDDIFLIFRFEFWSKYWNYTKKTKRGISPTSKVTTPYLKTKKNAEFIGYSTKGNNLYSLYKVKKEHCDFNNEAFNESIGVNTFEENGYKYYANNYFDDMNKPQSVEVFRTLDDSYKDNLYQFFLWNLLDNGTMKVSI
jgi:hypothetical protein